MTEHIGGYRIDLENREQLAATASPLQDFTNTFAAPEEIDPRGATVVENQGQQGACQGHDLSSVVEQCVRIATGDQIQLSRQYAYIATQRIDGLSGDVGSTISGGVTLAETKGLPPEPVWPYPGRYVATPPGGWDHQYTEAAPYKTGYHAVLNSYDDVMKFLGSGQGGVSIGIDWGLNPDSGGLVTRYQPQGRGGHAIALLGYTKSGNIWLLNSWGASWGAGGWAQITPSVIDAIARRNGNVMIGISDMKDAKPRVVDWKKASVFQ
jgi:C1A family cysteine protease